MSAVDVILIKFSILGGAIAGFAAGYGSIVLFYVLRAAFFGEE